MNTVTMSLGTLVDRTLNELLSPAENALAVTLTAPLVPTDTTFTLVDATALNPTDLVEFEDELLLVTAKSAVATPVFTVQRGYFRTTAVAHAVTIPGYVNPPYPRLKITEGIRRSFIAIEPMIPLLVTATFTLASDLLYVPMPVETRRVLQVVTVETNGQIKHINRWNYEANLPTAKFSTGKIISLPRFFRSADAIEVTYQIPYRWSNYPTDPIAASTITMMEGAEDLPMLYASAFQMTGREISRQQLMKSVEWNQSEPARNGASSALVRLKWQEFYRRLDEARRMPDTPLRRPYQKMAKVWG